MMSAKKRTDSRRASSPEKPVYWLPFQSRFLPLTLLIFISFIAYANAWPNSLVMDDVQFAVSERFLALGLADIPRFFTEDIWAASGVDSGLYRPFLLIILMIDAHVFGDWVAGYHLINILLHVLATVLVYGFVRHLRILSGGELLASSHIAILAALIFGVHPVHTEVVNSIFNQSEILVTIGVVGGLWWFLRVVEIRPWKAWLGLSLVYLLVLLCKESAAVLPALTVAVLWLTATGNWLGRTRKCLPVILLVLPLLAYLGLRANALQAPVLADEVVMIDQGTTDFATELFNEFGGPKPGKLLHTIRLGADSLKIMVWPHPLLIFHGPPSTGLWVALLLHITLLCFAVFMYFKSSSELLIGLLFFYLALLPSSQIFSDTGVYPLLAERYLYLPSVGLTIVLAFGLKGLVQRFGLRVAAVLIIVLTLVLIPMSWARNAEWASDILLDEADYRRGPQKGRILMGLVADHLAVKNYSRAVEICDRHSDEPGTKWGFHNKCGSAYYHAGRYSDAEQAYFLAIGNHKGLGMVHYDLAGMYLQLSRKSDAKRHFEEAIKAEKVPFLKELRTAMMLFQLYPSVQARLLEARQHVERAISMQPQSFQARQILEQIDERLGR